MAAALTFQETPDGPAAEAAFFENGHGLRLYVGRRSPPAGVQPRSVVVFLHGIDDHSGRWDHVGREMTATPVSAIVYSPDWQGHGRSMGASSHSTKNVRGLIISLESIAEDVGVVLRHVTKTHPGLPVFLFGHSMGCLISLHLLTTRADLSSMITGGLLLSAPALAPHGRDDTWFNWNVLIPVVKNVATKAWPGIPSPVPLGTELTHDEDFQAQDAKDPLRGLTPKAHTIVSAALEMKRLREPGVLEKVQLPWLALTSPDDTLVGPGAATMLSRTSTPPELREHHEFPGLWHELLREVPKRRAEVLQLVLTWLDNRTRAISARPPMSRL
eukprot:TRINITY_DN27465_c0_g1_i1.p1 TRINITY_DN27465_c0_g1~~TRINITY_DN27465_c0_g1_i1.p1  ORF type:complete len:329 (-),score=49.78 TRINITY_DN27465_c0_g1_i1:158-1144(-)